MKSSLAVVVALVVMAGAAPDARGQTSDTAARLRALEERVDALRPLAADLPALQGAVNDLTAEVRAQAQADSAPESAPAGGGGVHVDGGFRLASSGSFSLTLTGSVGYQLGFDLRDGETGRAGSSVSLARLGVEGKVLAPWLGYRLEVDFGGLTGSFGGGEPELTWASLRADLAPGLSVTAGRMRVPFSFHSLIDEPDLLFAERSLTEDLFAYDRDTGAVAAFERAGVRVAAGVWNGAGPAAENDNIDPLLGLRADYRTGDHPRELPAKKTKRGFELAAGASLWFENAPVPDRIGWTHGGLPPWDMALITDIDGDGIRDNVQVVTAAADATASLRWLRLTAEVYLRREDWGRAREAADPARFDLDNLHLAFIAQATALLGPDIALGARFARAEVTALRIGGDTWEEPPVGDLLNEAAAVVGWAPHDGDFQVTATGSARSWMRRDTLPLDAPSELRFVLEAQLSL